MKKQIIAGMMLLVLTVSGCSAVSTAPTTINELAEETRAEAETKGTDNILSSESKETDAPVESEAPEETESPESTAAPETEASQPIAEEAPKAPKPAAPVSSESKELAAETTPAPTEQPQAAQQEPQETQQPPTETPPPAPPQPTAAPEEAKPKTAYDYEFDIAAIKADCIGIGQSMGLSLDSSLTPDNAAWWNPVTASQSNHRACGVYRRCGNLAEYPQQEE